MKNFKELDKRKASEVEKSILENWKKEDILNETIEKIGYFMMDQYMQMQNPEFIMFLLKRLKIHFVNIIR